MSALAVSYVVAVLALAAALASSFAAFWRGRPRSSEFDQSIADRITALEAEARALREVNAQLLRDLAVERERSSRIPSLEESLRGQNDELRRTAEALRVAERELAEKAATLEEKLLIFNQLQEERLQIQKAFAMVRDENAGLQAKISALETELADQYKQSAEKLQVLLDARETLTREFKVLANDVLQRHGDVFAKQNKEQIDIVLQPLREKLLEFQQGLQSAQTDSAKERAALAEQIRQLSEASARMTSETTNLAQALRGNSQTQGAWGEMILASILERSGLRAGEEYLTQISHTNEEGDRLRPDVIVRLPGGQHVVIDFKVSLVAFEAFVAAGTEEERAEHLARHLDSMRSHIRQLSNKQYHVVAGSSLDYVVMFVPIEGALAAALQGDAGLTGFAVQNNVAIATPTTLMIALRTVESVWKIERRNSNAEAIADRAGKMYDKFVSFIEDLTKLGARLEQAQGAYRNAMGKISTGTGNLAGQFERLKELGARASKSLPAGLVGEEVEQGVGE